MDCVVLHSQVLALVFISDLSFTQHKLIHPILSYKLLRPNAGAPPDVSL